MDQSHGIVLRTFFPKKRTVVLLDQVQGKIVCVPNTDQVLVGSFITYHMYKRSSMRFMCAIEQIALPFALVRNDLLFYHHVLELCYYFIPLDSSACDVFSLLCELCCTPQEDVSYRYKILFLVRLFVLFGVQPEAKRGQWPRLAHLFTLGIDSVVEATIDLELTHEMYEWLHSCLSVHPLLAQFKTVHFLKKPEMESI